MKKGRAAAKKLRIEQQRADALEEMTERMVSLEEKLDALLAASGVVVDDLAETEAVVDDQMVYADMKVPALEDEAQRRGIYDAIEGSGADGNIVKADLVAALEADDESEI